MDELEEAVDDDLISIRAFATATGRDRSAMHRFVKRSGIPIQRVRDPKTGQTVTVASQAALTRLYAGIGSMDSSELDEDLGLDDDDSPRGGVFYFVQLMPEDAPMKVTTGFTLSLPRRLSEYRSAWYEALVVHYWPSRSSWERTVQDALETLDGVTRHGEQFSFADLELAIKHADSFFALLPSLVEDEPL